ncbi:hypothetical protein LZK98_07160 [Sphingomonas cannabina]|uniref:hypothetical protein n=1 Tax=Sphingomonas cannabina TaxID=2899123 RepID=UPI001F34803D|nr:hypothetical protein [Sphingomonas cannabina]UIJ46715.1 hypothetical protein LZK98_07160 [Sphingomonas cannabina]
MERIRPLPAPAVAALLLAAAVALRTADFGNPVIHVDEQYYLLVGERLLHGALPYVDIWDRKPIGLFLLYAGAAALPGDDILGYQLLACLSAAATAALVFASALRVGASRTGAIAAAIAYLVWLPLLGGRGGQAPVFYNLPVTAAAWLTLRLPSLERRPDAIVVNGLAACLLAGLAIQLKPTAAFEGAFFGLAHLWWLWRSGARAKLVPAVSLWLLAGAAPTLAAAFVYARLGHFDAWWFANLTSILLRPPYPASELAMRLLGIAAELSPLILCAVVAWRRRRARSAAERGLAFLWLGTALVGFAAIGTFFDHYALPLIAPLAVPAAIAFGRHPRALIGALGLGLLLVVVERAFVPNDGPGAREVARVVAANDRGGCPYVFIGDTITYSLGDACLPTAYAFPNFLAYTTEQGATGIDEAAEVRRILAGRPPVIVTSTRRLDIWNRASLAALKAALVRYRPVFSVPRAQYRTVVYLRRDLAFRN